MVERLAKFGVGADVLDEAAMGERFPLMNCDPMPKFDAEGNEVDQGLGAFSAVYEHGCGHMDSSTCLEDLHRACVRDGVDFRFKTKVAKFTLDGGRCTGAQLADGSAIEAAVGEKDVQVVFLNAGFILTGMFEQNAVQAHLETSPRQKRRGWSLPVETWAAPADLWATADELTPHILPATRTVLRAVHRIDHRRGDAPSDEQRHALAGPDGKIRATVMLLIGTLFTPSMTWSQHGGVSAAK